MWYVVGPHEILILPYLLPSSRVLLGGDVFFFFKASYLTTESMVTVSLQFLANSTKIWALTIPRDADPLLLWEHRIFLPIVCQTYFSEAIEERVKIFLAEFGLKLYHGKLTFFNGWQQNPQAIRNLMGSSEWEQWWQSGHLCEFAQMASKSDDCPASPDDVAYCCLSIGGTSAWNGSAGKLQ